MQTIDALTKITKARTSLILSQPFFGSLALRLPVVERLDIKTMATDGRSLFYSPAFVDSLGLPELIGVIAHEVLHCALAHTTRRGERDHGEWNIACDLAINPVVLDAGLTLPADVLIDPAFAGLSAEEIHARKFPPTPPADEPDDADDAEQDDGGAAGGGGCGEVLDAPADDGSGPAGEAERASLENEWRVATLQAAQQAKAAGELPGAVARLATDLREPRVDWRETLRRFMVSTAKDDFSWSRPNRRFVADGLYLPSRHSEALGEIVVVVDTSGSIDEVALSRFAAEINSICEDAPPARLHVVYADAAVAATETYEPADFPITLKAVGGGGTDFGPAFRWVEANDIEPACLIYLTDLYGPMPQAEPPYPVLWISTGADKAAWGEVVKLED